MPQSLQEYADWLANRDDLKWPVAPELVTPKATPYLKPLQEIAAVTFSVYGTLLHISDGDLLFDHEQQLRMQIALDKTIQEFNIWNSMSRKPGAPWEYMLTQYRNLLQDQKILGNVAKGEMPETNAFEIWKRLIERLQKNEYTFEESFYGDLDDFSLKVAYFFHSSLQGVQAMPGALETLCHLTGRGTKIALFADAQPFTFVQVLRGLASQGTLPPLSELFCQECFCVSYREGVRKPSASLYGRLIARFEQVGIAPQEILHVGTRIRDDLAIAKMFGMKTVLFAGDSLSMQASKEEVRNPDTKPDRLITNLSQLAEILD
ncbi:MAG: HAD family hydrolase [Planctomycetes bacterium]|nr:HAD family hydrolase [Planctomycetota bacterium]MCH9723738.1 HAD family hydrolase [Planctomycetota bacterium]MCH9776050.1 HAD family hydrolase [Planctomycetota bacterium]MCH9791945.1 HAD family hydrolase [Planctomycetota bacterium]